MAAKRSKYYTPESIKAYKEWEEIVINEKKGRDKFGTIILCQSMDRIDDTITVPCPKCKTNLKTKFGNYTNHLDTKVMECPMGKPEEGHGWYMSIINLMLN